MRRAALPLALLVAVHTAAAQSQQSPPSPSPLDKRVTLHVRNVALRDALDRIALLASIRLSYSGDNLPLDRRVSLDRDSSAISEVLRELLRGYAVDPVAVATDHVVLAPRQVAAPDSMAAQSAIAVLERVVVTGSVIGASERPLPIALDIVKGRDIERRDEGTLSEVLGGSVPGMWLWENTPTTLMARYGSIRGASSFGLSFPKIYVDGIEVANPLLLTQITPELVERVEVIRGPQGAALYGSDAISGVVNIVSRHEGAGPDGNRALFRSSVGYSASRYNATSAAVQEHSLTFRGGTNLRSLGATVAGSTSGQYIPEAYSRELRASADARLIGVHTKLTANLRFHGKDAGVPTNPLLAPFMPDSIDSDSRPQQLRLYSAGSTLTYVPNERWTYTVTAGVDGYELGNVSNELSPIPSVADTALRNANGSAVRGTFRASAVTSVGAPGRLGATFTLGGERSDLADRSHPELTASGSSGPGPGGDRLLAEGRSSNSGGLAQAVLAIRNAAYVTAGFRGEHISQSNGRLQNAALPLLGFAFVQDFNSASIKWRAGYGRGIRPARSTMYVVTGEPKRILRNVSLDPEEQSGIEFGTDVRIGRWLGVHVTRFDQLVSGLIQTVTVRSPTSSGPGDGSWYQLQNVGEITNRGWETQASLALGSLSFGGSATIVDSRVRQVAPGYTGDLRPGDRMLAVPARTVSGNVSFVSRRGLQITTTVSRASDWINYDRLAIADSLFRRSLTDEDLTGDKVRRFWVNYGGATRLRSTASVDFWRGLVLTVSGDNLLGYQLGEPDTITIVPGRTITVGVKARF
jgi:outer membrane receptor protein involved in Fe transport